MGCTLMLGLFALWFTWFIGIVAEVAAGREYFSLAVGETTTPSLSITTLIMLVSATTVALVLPAWGIHQRLKTLKQAQLKEIRSAITARRDPEARSQEDAQQLRAALVERVLETLGS